jgi:hypothetical protein
MGEIQRRFEPLTGDVPKLYELGKLNAAVAEFNRFKPQDSVEIITQVQRSDPRVANALATNQSLYLPNEWMEQPDMLHTSLESMVHPLFQRDYTRALTLDPKFLENHNTLISILTANSDLMSTEHSLTYFLMPLLYNSSNPSFVNLSQHATDPIMLQAWLTQESLFQNTNLLERISTVLMKLEEIVDKTDRMNEWAYALPNCPYGAFLGMIGVGQNDLSAIESVLKQAQLPKPITQALIDTVNRKMVVNYMSEYSKHFTTIMKLNGTSLKSLLKDRETVLNDFKKLEKELQANRPRMMFDDQPPEQFLPPEQLDKAAEFTTLFPGTLEQKKGELLEIDSEIATLMPRFPSHYDLTTGLPFPEQTFIALSYIPQGYHDSPELVTEQAESIVMEPQEIKNRRSESNFLLNKFPLSTETQNSINHIVSTGETEGIEGIELFQLVEALKHSASSSEQAIAFLTYTLSKIAQLSYAKKLPEHITPDIVASLESTRDVCFVIYSQKNIAIMRSIVEKAVLSEDVELNISLKTILNNLITILQIEKPA